MQFRSLGRCHGFLAKHRKRLLLLKKAFLAQIMLEDQRQRTWWVRPSWQTRHAKNEFFTTSIDLLAVVESDYKFVIVDDGAYGKQSDGGILEQSKFGCHLENGKLHNPRDLELPNTSHPAICVFVGDEGFQLRTDFLRPYPGRGLEGEKRIFNYRLSRARRCAENAFGVLVTRWRILARTMSEEPKQAEKMVKALCAFHNFQMYRGTVDEDTYCDPGFAHSVDNLRQRRSGHWTELLAQPPTQVART
ncbi:hypothetical protein MRX96_036725 [Rhipicephalus microplus]